MILMNDFKKEYSAIKQDIDREISKVLDSGWYILGNSVQEFEEKFAQYNGSKYCVGVANGLEAIQIALMACGIGPGDEVITVSNTAVATVLAISNTGATPVFADVDSAHLMDVEHMRTLITENTRAVIPVHLFGQMADIGKIRSAFRGRDIKIIEDACQAHGATQSGKKAGTIGDVGAFSFYPTKNLGGYGDGGAIVTDSEAIFESCKLLRNYGQKTRYVHIVKGLNSRLDEIQAAILNAKLSYLDEFVNRRNHIAKLYDSGLTGIEQVNIPDTYEQNGHSYHLYVIRAENRNGLMDYLKEHQIQALIHYPIPVHKQDCYSREYSTLKLPITEKYSELILSLPINPYLTDEDVQTVIDAIRQFYLTI